MGLRRDSATNAVLRSETGPGPSAAHRAPTGTAIAGRPLLDDPLSRHSCFRLTARVLVAQYGLLASMQSRSAVPGLAGALRSTSASTIAGVRFLQTGRHCPSEGRMRKREIAARLARWDENLAVPERVEFLARLSRLYERDGVLIDGRAPSLHSCCPDRVACWAKDRHRSLLAVH